MITHRVYSVTLKKVPSPHKVGEYKEHDVKESSFLKRTENQVFLFFENLDLWKFPGRRDIRSHKFKSLHLKNEKQSPMRGSTNTSHNRCWSAGEPGHLNLLFCPGFTFFLIITLPSFPFLGECETKDK